MESVGLRALRQDASELVRRVEDGEDFEITVSGRPAARLVPVTAQQWRRWDEIAHVLTGPGDPGWDGDRQLIDQSVENPWERRG